MQGIPRETGKNPHFRRAEQQNKTAIAGSGWETGPGNGGS